MTDVQVVWFPRGLAMRKKIRSNQTNLCFAVGLENSHLYDASAIFVSAENLLLCLFISLKKQTYFYYQFRLILRSYSSKHKIIKFSMN